MDMAIKKSPPFVDDVQLKMAVWSCSTGECSCQEGVRYEALQGGTGRIIQTAPDGEKMIGRQG